METTKIFKTEEEYKNSPEFINRDFVRVLKNFNTGLIEMEFVDYGTHLNHHNLLEINSKKLNK